MYVIEVDVRAGNITNLHFENNETHIVPAERCLWRQRQQVGTSNYEIFDVYFVRGDGTQVQLSGGTGATANVLRLGYISKTGRFVGMTV